MAQQHGAETPALDHAEGRLGAAGLQHDVAPTADDLLSAVAGSHHRDQCRVAGEVDIEKEHDFPAR